MRNKGVSDVNHLDNRCLKYQGNDFSWLRSNITIVILWQQYSVRKELLW